MVRQVKVKRRGSRLAVKIFKGKDDVAYIVFKTPKRKGGSEFHVLTEVEAKEAARECGAKSKGNTRQAWAELWESSEAECR